MSKTDDMAKQLGLHQRGGVWQLRVIIPLDVQGAYAGRSKVIRSLQTGDYAEAKSKAKLLHAEWDAAFEQKRRELNPQRIETVTPELSKALAARVSVALLRNDDKVRGNPEAARLFLDTLRPFRASRLRIPASAAPTPAAESARGTVDPLGGLTEEMAKELATVNADMDAHSATQMALQRVAAVLPLVKAEARSLGLHFDERAPGAVDALRESLRAYRKALQDIASRDRGEVIETPDSVSPAPARYAKAAKLRDVLPQWKASKGRKAQTVQAAEKALALYELSTGNPPISTLTRAQGVDMRAFLLAGGVTAKTARDRFDYIKGFLNFASQELELLPRNPWAGLAIEYTTTKPRRPWSSEQLASYFSRPLHTAYDLPTKWEAGADAAYWVPLLGIYTGARISELCQLRADDVSMVDGVPVLRITDEGEGQGVKTDAGRRTVPVHPELVRLGFLDFASAIRKAGSVQLFPALPLHKAKAGQYFSEWFASTRTLSDGTKLPDFHSLRHTVRSKLASAGIAEPLIDTLIGHEVKGSTGARTYTMRTTEDLQRAMSAVSYAGLSLPRVFVKPNVVTPRPKRTRG
jgi:integrase